MITVEPFVLIFIYATVAFVLGLIYTRELWWPAKKKLHRPR